MNSKHSHTNTFVSGFDRILSQSVLLPLIVESYLTTIHFKYGENKLKWPQILRQEFAEFKKGNIDSSYQKIIDFHLNQKLFPWENEKDTQVPFGAVYEYENKVLLILRGTTGPYEWFKNTRFILNKVQVGEEQVEVHLGFYELFEEILSSIMHLEPLFSEKQFIIAGHSLGGAIAQLLALNWKNCFPIVYTFGSPRVGNQHFVQLMDQFIMNHYRLVNSGDLVTELPPVIKNIPLYYHSGTEILLNSQVKEEQSENIFARFDWKKHLPSAYLKALDKVE